MGRIVVFRSCKGLRQDLPGVQVAVGIWSHEGTPLVIAGNQGYRRTDDNRIVFDDASCDGFQAVRMVQAPPGYPHIVPEGGLRLVEDIRNLYPCVFKFAFGTQRGFTLQALHSIKVLEKGRHLDYQGGEKNQQDAGPHGLPQDWCLQFHSIELKPARNSGMGHLQSLSTIRVLRPAYGRISSSMSFRERSWPK